MLDAFQLGVTFAVSLGSIIVWEFVKLILPEGMYSRLVKFQRRLRFRNRCYPLLCRKSYELRKVGDPEKVKEVKELVKTLLGKAFMKNALELIQTPENEFRIQANVKRLNTNFQIIIDIEAPVEEDEEEGFRIYVTQKAEAKFNSIEKTLELMFHNYYELEQAFYRNSIEPSSEKVRVELESGDIKVFLELMDKLAEKQIVTGRFSVVRKDKSVLLSFEDKMSPELFKRVQELVLLGNF